MKLCSICGVSKAQDQFYTNSGKCKPCQSLEIQLRKNGEFLPERFCVRCCEVKTREHFPVAGKTLRQWCTSCESPEGHDWCFVCFEHKPLEEFNHRASGRKCQDCRKTYQKNYDWYRKYGILPEEYERVYKKQNGCCWICGKYEEYPNLVVDHNHAEPPPGMRGLLCSPCNTGLGLFNDDPRRLAKAQEYLLVKGWNVPL